MGDEAAFFDLDRTLLRGASGPAISEALRSVGVLNGRPVPGEQLLYRFFDAVGETLPSMLLTRQAARVARGWNREQVRAAGRRAAERLRHEVPPFARLAVARHRSEGRRLVLATTSPHDLVAPLAEELGFDAVIATRYGERDGAYDGSLAGEFVWGPGKLRAVRTWAEANGVDLAGSWAYSDSIFDAPLLLAVAHPVAVNPDPRLWALAVLRRWPVQFFDVPPGVPKLAGLEPQRLLQRLAIPQLFPFVRFDIRGDERLPATGPAILVANHRSYFDPLAVGMLISRAGRPVRFLGKKEVFDAPGLGALATAIGGIRVDRGSGSGEPLAAAADALAAGELVALMPQGTIPRGREFFNPELKGRWGAARLAAQSRAPVIPIGLWGTEKVWPRSARVPNVVNLTAPPRVTVRVGDPVVLKHRSLDADTRRIMAAIVDLLPFEARRAHEPTPAELARTFPPGRSGEGAAERARHPGSD